MNNPTTPDKKARFRSKEDYELSVPVHCVWEITLGCDLRCVHCGSRAGQKRKNELSLSECHGVVEHLAHLGTREINLIGGEVYLRKDWLDIIASVKAHGMRCLIQSGGRNLTTQRIADAKKAGLDGLGISIDGLGLSHDRLRGVVGSFEQAIDALRSARELEIESSVNTQLTRSSITELDGLLELLIENRVAYWQLQMTVPMGNAVDNDEILLQPYDLLELMPRLARLYRTARARGVQIMMGNNIGYFGPYEHLWRGLGDSRVHWTGCSAAKTVIALESDGTVKGCPSLETSTYKLGNVRDLTLKDIWKAQSNRQPYRKSGKNALKGYCKDCYYSSVCKAGCTWMAHSLFFTAGDNPYCHYRALKLQDQGLRERVEKVSPAADTPFSTGMYRLVQEQGLRPDQLNYPSAIDGSSEPQADVADGFLGLCMNCKEFVFQEECDCPHCGRNIAESQRIWLRKCTDAQGHSTKLSEAMRALESSFNSL